MTTPYAIEKENQTQFDNILYNLLEMIDLLTERYVIKDGEYKELVEALMSAKNLQVELKQNAICVALQKRVERARNGKSRTYTLLPLDKKINNPDYIMCNKCNRYLLKKNDVLEIHQKTNVCINTYQAKLTTYSFKSMAKNRIAEVSQVLNVYLKMRQGAIKIIGDDGEPVSYNADTWEEDYKTISNIMREKHLYNATFYEALKHNEDEEEDDDEYEELEEEEEERVENKEYIAMNCCIKENNLKRGGAFMVDGEQFKYLYGDYYSNDFINKINEDTYFTIRTWYEDKEYKMSVNADMYWNVEDADMVDAEKFIIDCNKIKHYSYNTSSRIAMMLSGIEHIEEEEEEEEKYDEANGGACGGALNGCLACEEFDENIKMMEEECADEED